MKKWIVLASVIALAGCASAPGSHPAHAANATAMKTAPAATPVGPTPPQLKAITTYKFGQSREPLTVVQDMVRESLSSPQKSKVLAAQLAALLSKDVTYDCKDFVCRQLAIIGTPENVPALAALLAQDKTADIARYALQQIPGPEADAALINALPQASSNAKIGIITTLGARRTAKAAKIVRSYTKDPNPAIAKAAKSALRRIHGK